MKDMNKNKFEIVKKYIDEMDYMGLLDLGCPKSEYDSESERIANRINLSMSVEEIALIIGDVFINSFFTGIDISDPSDPKDVKLDGAEDYNKNIGPAILKTATNIYNDLHKSENKDQKTLSTKYIIDHLSDNPNSTLSAYRFKKGEFYENNLSGKIKEAFCYKINHPKYKGEPLYVVFEEDPELFEWFTSDNNTEYPKEAEYAKFIIDWKNKYGFNI